MHRATSLCTKSRDAQNYLQAKSDSHPGFTWTAIANGLFLDWAWGLQSGVIVDLAQHSATLSDAGDVPLSAPNLADVAEAVLRGLYSIASRLGIGSVLILVSRQK